MHPFDFFKPSPVPYTLIRLGGEGDGAYILPYDLNGIDACFSPGVNNFKAFEDQLCTDYGIKAHMCDFSSDPEEFMSPLVRGMQTFAKLWLDIEDSQDSITLEDWVSSLSPDKDLDLILQMDIEGAEYRNLLSCSDELLRRFRIIIIELHRLNEPEGSIFFESNIRPLCDCLAANHVVVHAHANNCCGQYIDCRTGMNIPSALELTLLRRDRFESSHDINHVMLPHPQDISRNVKQKPPIHLNSKWLRSGPSYILNETKIISDYSEFVDYTSLQDSIKANTIKLYQESAETMQRVLRHSATTSTHNHQDTDVAAGKSYYLSSAYGGYSNQGVVSEIHPFFFHTDIGLNQRITVDLGDKYDLNRLEICNRSDGWGYRARCIFVQISDHPKLTSPYTVPVATTDDFVSGKKQMIIILPPGLSGRYFSILSPIETALHFSALRVYGHYSI